MKKTSHYIADGAVTAYELCSLLKHLKPSLVEKLCWEQNLEYLTKEELKQIENAVHAKFKEERDSNTGVDVDTFYSDA